MRRAAVATGLVLSVILVVWIGWSWWSPSASPLPPGGSAAPTVAATTTEPNTAAPAPSEPPPWVKNPEVPGANSVRRLAIRSAGYASSVKTMAIADTGVIDPPDFAHLWWVSDRGVAPSSTASDTTYFSCHTSAKMSTSQAPCNKVSLENTPVGSTIEVTTASEQLTYRVTQSRRVARTAFASDAEVWDVNPGRLVVVTCHLEGGQRTAYNLVLIAELVR